jgi:cobaltochelatase CobT
MLRWLWSRLARPAQSSLSAPSPPGEYRAYTTQYDLEVRADDLPKQIGSAGYQAFRQYAEEFDRSMAGWRAAADIAALATVDRVKAAAGADLDDTVATLLIDHSGSMRGQRAMIATALAEITAEFWGRLGISFEILGFTTRSWKGGFSRKQWWWHGRPANPGRLCDLLHIVYRSADESKPGAPWSIRYLMWRQLLKENVDGEAIEWAARRLLSLPGKRRILVVVSDGAPVDDSTLSANEPAILHRHIKKVIATVRDTTDIRLASVGLDYDVGEYYPYPESIMISSTGDFATRLLPFLAALFEAPPGVATPSPGSETGS